MSRITLFQRVRPFAVYCLVLVPIILIITVIPSGIFKNEATSTSPQFVQLTVSNKYAAGSLEGVEPSKQVKVISGSSFEEMINAAQDHKRKRKMVDFTKTPEKNSMQTLINTWMDGSYSPIHMHSDYSEAFVVLRGALAFFTFQDNGEATCNVINDLTPDAERVIIVEKNQWHAMTAAPAAKGWPGLAVVFETSGHTFDTTKPTKTLAPFAPIYGEGMDGDPAYFGQLLSLCPAFKD